MVRQARQTFGETLPKDYLSIEEYVIYERLYGPPLRETKPEDLEYLPEGEDEVDPDKVRNVLLKQNAMGDYEEIEFDPELGYSVTDGEIPAEEVNESFLGHEQALAEAEELAEEFEQAVEVEDILEILRRKLIV